MMSLLHDEEGDPGLIVPLQFHTGQLDGTDLLLNHLDHNKSQKLLNPLTAQGKK